jgi:hypothetical protein
VDRDQDGRRVLAARDFGPIVVRRHFAAIERFEANAVRHDELARIEPADLAERPLRKLSAGDIERVRVRRRLRPGERHAQRLAIGRKLETRNNPQRCFQFAPFELRRIISFEDEQAARAILVDGDGDLARLVGDGQLAHVPRQVFRQPRVFAALYFQSCQAAELAGGVGGDVNMRRVGGKSHRTDRRRFVSRQF